MERIFTLLGLLFVADSCLSILYHSTNTEMGIIVGKIEDATFRDRRSKVMEYLGIPYAKSQTRDFRFQTPFVYEPFEKPYNATFFRPACSNIVYGQANIRMSEDCLFLNIYAPIESTINPTRKYPVLVYFHGGEFMTGSSQDVSPEVMTFMGDVIVVTVNFRIGVFGFLSMGNEHMPGNYGLWDQHLAIKWIRFNIGAFGGDVDRITLIGQDSGALSVLLHAMYPGNRGLFNRVISISGGELNPWALSKPSAYVLAKKVGCVRDDEKMNNYERDSAISECLRSLQMIDLLAASADFRDIGPTVDGNFLKEHPYNILFPKNKTESDALEFYRSLDVIIGTNDNDGDRELLSILRQDIALPNLEDVYIGMDGFENVLVPTFLSSFFKHQSVMENASLPLSVRTSVGYSTIFHYKNWTNPENSENYRNGLLQLSTELTYETPMIKFADAHSFLNPNQSTYIYQFVHNSSYADQEPKWIRGARHGSQTNYIFGFPSAMIGLNRQVPEIDYKVSENMMKWISNFAKTGNPNKPFLLFDDDREWPLYDSNRKYMEIGTNFTTHARFGEPSTSFWSMLVPALLHSRDQCQHNSTSNSTMPGSTYFTALKIPSQNISVVIIVLICVTVVLFILLLMVSICLLRIFI